MMFYTNHRCEWCDRDEPTVCVETPHFDGLKMQIQYSYLCLWCLTDEYNRKFIVDKPPNR